MGYELWGTNYETGTMRPGLHLFANFGGSIMIALDLFGELQLVGSLASTKPLIVISGPSGSGKSTLLKRLVQEHPGVFGYSTSHTTRSPRPGEEDGREYHFVTRSEFQNLCDRGTFLEWAEFSKNLYGTSINSVRKIVEAGQMCIMDIDLQGVHSVKNAAKDLCPRFIFIKPPSFEELRARLQARSTETDESLAIRLKTAESEMRYADENPGFHDFVVVNDNLEQAYKNLKVAIFGKAD
ncbi:hypothetical protein PSACC_01811 [Paramicrosporidium saccamoebae]|uniref:Guanylate kinase n=1 Tax=Paramicrosporidium saccamoebae TaxID=1246581 RepID=A0A2H9TKW9_9FUNG|nr:hypothetical protein PSACC_01811 [Paramicrosporidium saccamoebae]